MRSGWSSFSRVSVSFSLPSSLRLTVWLCRLLCINWDPKTRKWSRLSTWNVKSSLLLPVPHYPLSSHSFWTTQGTFSYKSEQPFPWPISAPCGPHLPINYNWLAILTEIIIDDYSPAAAATFVVYLTREREEYSSIGWRQGWGGAFPSFRYVSINDEWLNCGSRHVFEALQLSFQHIFCAYNDVYMLI